MPQDFPSQYYMVVDEKSTGPYSFEEISRHPALKPHTLVWKPGIDNWVPANTLPEFDVVFTPQFNAGAQTPPEFNNSYPGAEKNFQNPGSEPNQNWNGYQENSPRNHFADNPQYRENHTYQNNYSNHQNHYHHHGYRPEMRTNWLPWAIVATVFGFFTSCIGAIFGIIGIVQANKANTFYAQGFDREGDAANSNARIMTIIGLVLAGIGIIIAFSLGGIFNNLSYLN